MISSLWKCIFHRTGGRRSCNENAKSTRCPFNVCYCPLQGGHKLHAESTIVANPNLCLACNSTFEAMMPVPHANLRATYHHASNTVMEANSGACRMPGLSWDANNTVANHRIVSHKTSANCAPDVHAKFCCLSPVQQPQAPRLYCLRLAPCHSFAGLVTPQGAPEARAVPAFFDPLHNWLVSLCI